MKIKVGDSVKIINGSYKDKIGTVINITGSANHVYMAEIRLNCGYRDRNDTTIFKSVRNDYVYCNTNNLRSLGESNFNNEMLFEKRYIPQIKNVYFNNPLTIVIWNDGSKTFVKNMDGASNYDPEKGLAMAISKKALGNKYRYYKEFERYCNLLPSLNTKFKCPICGYSTNRCQCIFDGSSHPDRQKRAEVVMDHLYLFAPEQIKHVIFLQKYWNISYSDKDKADILESLNMEVNND